MSYDVDINQLPMLEEEETGLGQEVNTEAEFYTTAPPVPDGTYQVKLAVSERMKNVQAVPDRDTGKPKFYMVFVQGQVIAPGTSYDNRFLRDVVSTSIMSNGSCKAVAVLKACGVPGAEIPRTHAGIIKKLYDTLQSSPQCKVRTQWQAQSREKDADGKRPKPFLKGERNFPQIEGGRHNHMVEDPETGDVISAEAVITMYSPIVPF